ncbi:MAG TPA: hypothetical protein VF518_02070, partial [Polyangia bacterium]
MRTTTCLQAAIFLAVSLSRTGDAAPNDPAARGLDLFVHAPSEVASGGTLPVQVRVFGFPTVSTLTPLPGIEVEAVWDPESLGGDASSVPPAVRGTCDEAGRVHLDVPVPDGGGALKLLLSARSNEHERTRTLNVARSTRYSVGLRVSDTQVVPGGAVSTWVLMRDLFSGLPVPNANVDVVLKEGQIVRFSRRLVTDAAGTAATQVRVPFTDDPDWTWTLTAQATLGGRWATNASTTLGVREEKPQAPQLKVRWTAESVAPGNRASFEIRLQAGTSQGIAKQSLRYWVGPRGTQAPKDDQAWLRASTEATTDADGKVAVTMETPRTISPRGSSLTVLAKALVEGHPLSGESTLPLQAPKPLLEVLPEFGVLLPGQSQRLFLHATLAEKPLTAEFVLEGHGLAAHLKTNERGWGETVWNLPREVGANFPDKTQIGCAGQVAATLRIRLVSPIPEIGQREPFEQCLRVDRDALGLVRPARPLVRAGDAVTFRVIGAKSTASLVLQGLEPGMASSAWISDTTRGGTVAIPPLAQGLWSASAAGIAHEKDKSILPASLLVVPRVLPRLSAKWVNQGQAAPGGTAVLEADLDDAHGKPLVGSVGAVVFDKFGGSNPRGLLNLDTRHALTAGLNVADSDIDNFLDGDSRFDMERWAALANPAATPLLAAFDPPATVRTEIDKVFAEIV